jgi:hypothetical protein
MSVVLYVCWREAPDACPLTAERIEVLGRRLTPSNVCYRQPEWFYGAGVLACSLLPHSLVTIENTSVLIGGPPDGPYGTFCASTESVEISSDMVASRTIWYVRTDSMLVVSTSQRAIVAVLGSFEPHELPYPWMLSAGSLGPGLSWDARIACIPGNSVLRLDRRRWSLAIQTHEERWRNGRGGSEQYARELTEQLESVFRAFRLPDDAVVPLSGGYDSRGVLLFLLRYRRPGARIRTLTWGKKDQLQKENSDAFVAARLCATLGVDHQYHVLESEEHFPDVLRRFIEAGEGRTDHISGYLDGFALWKRLSERGIGSIVRGDIAFGYRRALCATDLYRETGILRLDEYENGRELPGSEKLPQQQRGELERRPGESLELWNARLGHRFRLGTTLAALTHLKVSYVEVLNPLLAPTLVALVRSLPSRLRVNKQVFKDIVRRMSPPVPFATSAAIASHDQVLRRPEVHVHLKAVLRNNPTLLPAEMIDTLVAALRSGPPTTYGARQRLRQRLPDWAAMTLRALSSPHMDFRRVALRAAIVVETHQMFSQDSRLFANDRSERWRTLQRAGGS